MKMTDSFEKLKEKFQHFEKYDDFRFQDIYDMKKKEAKELARKKQEDMLALQKKIRETSDEAGKKRLEELAKQEELFREKASKFAPIMGTYTSTNNFINGKKVFGYINFGNGVGNQDLTKEEYDDYAAKYKKVEDKK
jgi:hypothetical protein